MQMTSSIPWIGLTGGIASGKSTVAHWFRSRGVTVIDADQVARKLRAPGGDAHDEILHTFGTANSRELRALVFGDLPEQKAARAKLEAILHPKIQQEAERWAAASGATWILYEASLLVETGRDRSLEALIVVTTTRALQIQRLIQRENLTIGQAEATVASQTSDAARCARATWIIDNSGTLAELELASHAVLKNIESELAKPSPFQRHSVT